MSTGLWAGLEPDVRKKWEPYLDQLVPSPPLLTEFAAAKLSLDEFDARLLAEKVKQDPVLAGQILSVANSAKYGLVQPMINLQRAMIHLGFNMVKSIVISYTLGQRFNHLLPVEFTDFIRRWSAITAVIAFRWGQQAQIDDAATPATVALLSRVGTLLLGFATPRPDADYQNIESEPKRLEFEQSAWQIITPILSSELTQRWGIPAPVPELVGRAWEPLIKVINPDPLDPCPQLLPLVAGSTALATHFIQKKLDEPEQLFALADYQVLRENLEHSRLLSRLGDVWRSSLLQRELVAVVE